MMLTSSAALVIACIGFVAYDLVLLRNSMVTIANTRRDDREPIPPRSLLTTGRGSGKPQLLRAKRGIISASIYAKNGEAFACTSRISGNHRLLTAECMGFPVYERDLAQVVTPVGSFSRDRTSTRSVSTGVDPCNTLS